jgi:hypothetical protein
MKELQALIHLVIAIALLTLGVQILITPDTYTSIQNIFIIAFSTFYSIYCYKDKLFTYIRNKDDTQ